MKITDGEKLIILMLSDLYEKLGIEGEIEPDFMKSAILSDNLWGISWRYSGIPFEKQDDPEIVKQVVDILDMWSFIEHGYKQLSDADKAKLVAAVDHFGKDPKFQGFDGNNESAYMSVAQFIVHDLERFEEFKERDLNSHMPTLEKYGRMLSVFEPIRKSIAYGNISLADLVTILNEQIHPENR